MRDLEKKRAYDAAYNISHRKEMRERCSRVHREHKVKCIAYKGGKCAQCGLEYDGTNGAIFHFHHIDPSLKESGIGDLGSVSWERTVIELDKCVMLCANCHSLVHAGRY